MAGQLDSLFKSVAKDIVSTLGDSFDHTITFIKKGVQEYDVDNAQLVSIDTTYSDIKAPLEFIESEEEEGQEEEGQKGEGQEEEEEEGREEE